MGKRPTILVTPSQQKTLMGHAIKELFGGLRLERCMRFIWGAGAQPDGVTWERVLAKVSDKYADDYHAARSKAKEDAKKRMPSEKKQSKMTADNL